MSTASVRAEAAASRPDRVRPWMLAGLTALTVCRPLLPSESAAPAGDGLPLVMLEIVLLALWLAWAVVRGDQSLRLSWTDAALLLLIVLHSLAGIAAASHAAPRPALNMLWEWIGLGTVFFLTRQLVLPGRELRAVIAAMIAMAAGLSAYGLYQATWEWPRAESRHEARAERGLAQDEDLAVLQKHIEEGTPLATFDLTNSLAALLAPWLVLSGGLAIGAWRERDRQPGYWLAATLCVAPIAVCLVLTRSRSGMIAAAVGLIGAWLCATNSRRTGAASGCASKPGRRFAISAALIAILALVATTLAGRFGLAESGTQLLTRARLSFSYRVQYARATLSLIGDHLLLGCGPGNFQEAYTRYKAPEASEEPDNPHNFLLEVWATAGTPAVLTLLAALGCFAVAMWRGGRTSLPAADERPGAVAVGMVAGFLLAPLMWLGALEPPSAAAVWIGLPVAAVCLSLLRPWVADGSLPRLLPALALVSLLIALSSSGGIGYPGVASSFWLLLALSLNHSGAGRSIPLRRGAGLTVLVVAVTLSVACFTTAFLPVLRCNTQIRQAQAELKQARRLYAARTQATEAKRLMTAAKGRLESAAAADPLDSRHSFQLAEVAFFQWELSEPPDADAQRQFEEWTRHGLERSPDFAAAWNMAGVRLLAISRRTDEANLAHQAVDYCRRAAELYPNSARIHASLALAFAATGDRQSARREAQTALDLDDVCPHEDKKLKQLNPDLPHELRRLLSRGGAN